MSVLGSRGPPTATSSIASHASAGAAAELGDYYTSERASQLQYASEGGSQLHYASEGLSLRHYASEGRGTAVTSSVRSGEGGEAEPSVAHGSEMEEHDMMEGLSEEERLLHQQQLLLFQQQQLEEQQQQQLGGAEEASEGGAASFPGGGTVAATAGTVLSTPPPMLPFSPPDSVKTWLRREDWEALSRAWAEAEAQAVSWAEGEGEDFEDDDDFWDDEDESAEASRSNSLSSNIATTSITSSMPYRRAQRRPKWDQDFALIGIDSRRPQPLRRYFDPVPAETSPPVQAVRRELRPKPRAPFRDVPEDDESPAAGKERWIESWGSVASSDNDKLHPYLRHYFSNRGLEASYRQRPHIDSKWLRELKPRTPGRPSTREKIEKWRSASEPALGAASSPGKKQKVVLDAGTRGAGSIHWGTRCLIYGPDGKVRTGPNGEAIPWVYDHHISETEDNELMNPLLRHYFDQEGVESSFRNRGRDYGRAKKACFGLAPIPQGSPSAQSSAQASPQQPRSASLRGSSSQHSSGPSQPASRQPSSLPSGQPFSRQMSASAPSQLPSQPHSRATSVLNSQRPSRRPSMQPSPPHSRHPSLQPLGINWPIQASPPASLPSRQSSMGMSRQGRGSIASPIGSVAGSIVGSVEAGGFSRRITDPPAPALPAC